MPRLLPLALVFVVAACAGDAPPPSSGPSDKPLPPIDVAAKVTDLGGGRWKVDVTAAPLTDASVFGAELVLPPGVRVAGGHRMRALRAAHAGDRADFTAVIEAPAGSELLASTTIRTADGFEGGRTVCVPLGPRTQRPARAAPKPRRVVHTPAGDVAEVGP